MYSYENNASLEKYQIIKDLNYLKEIQGSNSNSIVTVMDTDYGHIDEFVILRPKRKFIRNSVEATNQLVKLRSDFNFVGNQNKNSILQNSNKVVLVVDDNQMNRFPIVEIMKSFKLNYE